MHGTALIFVLIYSFALISGNEVNYCGSKMCGYSNTHTFCQFSSGPSNSCTGLIPAPLSSEEKSRILARLNRRRNSAASGKLRGLPSAANMLRLRWVQELAREAQLWADQCRPPKTPEEQDECRDLYAITVGQCVASVVGESPGLRVETMVDIWFMQSMYYKGNVTTYEPPDPSRYYYGDFAQMLWAGTFMVGCGRSRFILSFQGRPKTIERLVCNFAPKGPATYASLWTIGTPASACPEHSLPYPLLTSLCEYQNELNKLKDNTSITLEELVLLSVMLEIGRNESQLEGNLDEIYLSNLADAMQRIGPTTMHYNSVQKREVVEKIFVENINESTNTVNITKLMDSTETTTKSQTIQNNIIPNNNNTIRPLKKLKIVGRPKAYNMEDLSDTDGDLKEQNHDVTKATLSTRKKEFYYDYNLDDDMLEDNVTMKTEPTTLENYFIENYSFEDHTFTIANITVVTLDQTIFDGQINEELRSEKTLINLVTTTAANKESLANKDKVMDDYLSDPETIKQLQDALARVEREAITVSVIPGKSRRDLTDSDDASEQLGEENTPLDSEDFTLITDNDEIIEPTVFPLTQEEQKTPDAPVPMLDMMLKYLPYLKSYDMGLMGSSSSTSLSSVYFGLEPNGSMCFMVLISLYMRNFNVF